MRVNTLQLNTCKWWGNRTKKRTIYWSELSRPFWQPVAAEDDNDPGCEIGSAYRGTVETSNHILQLESPGKQNTDKIERNFTLLNH